MSDQQSLIFHSPNVSKAVLMDMLGGLALHDSRVKVRPEFADGNLACDPATVALITAGGFAVVELIKSATSIYLDRHKSKPADPPQPARVTVFLTMGGKRTATVTEPGQLDEPLHGITDYAEIARVELA
jgi:hypothetical protein